VEHKPLGAVALQEIFARSGDSPDQGPGGVTPAWTRSPSKHQDFQETTMDRRQFTGARNKLDLNNRVQVRIVRKRLKISNEQLSGLVRTAGNSIAAVNKEATSRRRLSLPGLVPPAEGNASVK